jgi:hypothetical protein
MRPYLKENPFTNIGCWSGSRYRPVFKPWYPPPPKKRKKGTVRIMEG